MAPPVTTSFFQVITNSAFEEGILKLPNKFVYDHGNEFSGMVSLSIPTGRCWDVSARREANGEIFLRDGFSKFMEDNGVGIGYFLIFKHVGNSKLLTLIYNKTAAEILYNCSGDSERRDVVNEVQMVETDDKGDDSTDRVFPTRDARTKTSPAPAKKIQLMLPNSSRVDIRPYHMNKGSVRLSSAFAKAHLGCSRRHVILVDANGKEWNVRYVAEKYNYVLTSGWHGFARDKELAEGDVCIFELVGDGNDVKLKVTIQRRTD